MKLLKRLLLVAILPFTFALPAEARIYRTPDSRVFITNLAPQQRISITYNSVSTVTGERSNSCGHVQVFMSDRTTSLVVAGRAIDFQSLSVQSPPICTNGVLSEARPTNYRTPNGDVMVVGLPPDSPIQIAAAADRSRSATSNACGIATFTSTTAYNHANAAITYRSAGLVNLGINRLPLRDMPLCLRGRLFFPLSWLGQRYP